MRQFRWAKILFLFGGISAVLLYFISQAEDFPLKVMLIYEPAYYVWDELQASVGKGWLRELMRNVFVFGLLAAVEGAAVGLLFDLFIVSKRSALDRRVGYLRRSTDGMDLAFKRRVLEILAKHDPAGLIKSGSDKEAYKAQADLILVRLGKVAGAANLQRSCRKQFRKQFGSRAVGGFKRYDLLAKDIWRAYERQHSSTKRSPPVSEGL